MKYFVSGAVALVLAGAFYGFFFGFSGKKINITHEVANVQAENTASQNSASSSAAALNPLTGETCADGGKRPIAVMLSGDATARPLAGIAQADVVVEMPVLTNSITRFMAVFRCSQPQEIGPIRSARHDFLPFSNSFDAVFAHWGGSYLALDILHTGALDNIDAMQNPFDSFYRKDDRVAPNNGFASFAKLSQTAEQLHYRMENKARGYAHIKDEAFLHASQRIVLSYPFPYNVEFMYDPLTNSYARYRGGEKEIDAASQEQVAVKNLIVMTAPSEQVNKDYNTVDVQGEGTVTVYRNGEAKAGKWKRIDETYSKNSMEDNKYYFVDGDGSQIGLVPGKIWISIVQPNQKAEQIFN